MELFQDGPVTVRRFGVPYSFARLTYNQELTRYLGEVKADIFHVHVPNPSMIISYVVALIKQRLPAVPLVVTYHSDHVNQPVRGVLFRPLENFFFSQVDRIIATSQPYVESSTLLHHFEDKVTVVPLGIPTAPFRHPTPAQKARAEEIKKHYEGPIWISCSRLVPYKGIEFAIRAMNDAPGHLLILGDGPERDHLSDLTHQVGLADRVHFLGFQPDLIPYLLAATALWLSSINRAEAFGIVQVEAMAAGIPVINCHIPGSGVEGVSVNGETGFTVPHANPMALARAATDLHADPELRARFSANASRRAQRDYDLSACLTQTMAVYEQAKANCRIRHRKIDDSVPYDETVPHKQAHR